MTIGPWELLEGLRESRSAHRDEIWILDAANLSKGPITRLGHPALNLGFTIHTTWTESAGPRTSSNYMITAREDYDDIVQGMDAEVVKMFEEEIYPRFGG